MWWVWLSHHYTAKFRLPNVHEYTSHPVLGPVSHHSCMFVVDLYIVRVQLMTFDRCPRLPRKFHVA